MLRPLLILILLTGVLFPFSAFSQEALQAESIQVFQRHPSPPSDGTQKELFRDSLKKRDFVSYFTASGPSDLDSIARHVDEGSYILIKKQSFVEGVKAVNKLQGKIAAYQRMDSLYVELEAIEVERMKIFETILDEERKRGQLYDTANIQLQGQIVALDTVFHDATDATKEAIKVKKRGKWGMAFIGGAIGVSVGVLLGLIGR